MEIKEFELALKKGQGRCIKEIQCSPTKYRKIIEKYITKCLSFDPIFEGTRSRYMYDIISYYDEKDFFYNLITNAFKNTRFNNIWDFHYLSEMLVNFYNDGYSEANNILWDKYKELYEYIYNKKKKTKGTENVIQMFEMICLEITFDIESFIIVIKQIAELLQNNNYITINDFSWLCDAREQYLEEIVKYEEQYPEIKYFLNLYLEKTKSEISNLKNNDNKDIDVEKQFSLSLANQNIEVQKDYAYKYLEAKEEKDKIKYLKCFTHCPFPLLPEFIIEDTKSENKQLKEIAYEALSIIKDNTVKQYALSQINTNLKYVLPILFTNYNKDTDKELIKDCIKNLNISKSDNLWHKHYMAFLNLFDIYDYYDLPYEVLNDMYENTLCSYCRGFIIDRMLFNNQLSEDIINECLFDCNTETVELINEVIKFKDNNNFY